jgi:hypothetical protein
MEALLHSFLGQGEQRLATIHTRFSEFVVSGVDTNAHRPLAPLRHRHLLSLVGSATCQDLTLFVAQVSPIPCSAAPPLTYLSQHRNPSANLRNIANVQ